MTAVAAAVTRLGTHRRLTAMVLGIASLPAISIVVSFGLLAVWIAVMLAAAAGTVWFMAMGFDRRYPAATTGSAVLRIVAVLGSIALGMLFFADPWTFGQPTSARVAFGGLMTVGLALAIWFGRTGEASQAPAGKARMVSDRMHLIVAIVAAAVVLPVSFLLALLIVYCSSGEAFYWIFGAGLVVAAVPVVAAVLLDRRIGGRDGAAAAIGRIGLILIATMVIATFLLSLAPLSPVECN